MDGNAPDSRKIRRATDGGGCPVERGPDGTWQVRGFAAGRAVLRSTGTVQAGLGVETVENMPRAIRRPVLYRDGPEHREHRRQTARFFTPRKVDADWRAVMERVAESQLAKVRAPGGAQLSELSFDLAIEVASAVIGLTESRPGIRHRLERFFPDKFGTPGLTSVDGVRWLLRQAGNWGRFYLADVRPAVRARRRRRRADLISHLLDEGCSSAEILGECLTFAAAGMVTTREFVNLAAWQLFTDPELLRRYRNEAESGRLALLHEILRLDPVIGQLRRRTTEPLDVPAPGGTVTVPEGELVEVDVGAANTDPAVAGARPRELCPGREMDGAPAPGLSFGDGPHKCPGAGVAILETDIFLSRLLAEPGIRMRTEPAVTFQDAIGGYVLRGLVVTSDRR